MKEETQAQPIAGISRLQHIDILRGFAIFGIYVFNMVYFSGDRGVFYLQWETSLDNAVIFLINFLVQAKFYSLFSFLFGWGMAVQYRSAQKREQKFVPLWLRRISILLLIGFIHGSFIWDGDILTSYAFMGFVLILFRNRSDKFIGVTILLLLAWGSLLYLPYPFFENIRSEWSRIIGFVTGSFWEPTSPFLQRHWAGLFNHTRRELFTLLSASPQILAMMLLGFAFGRRRVFTRVDERLAGFKKLLITALAIGVPLNLLFALAIYWRSVGEMPAFFPDPTRWTSFILTTTRTWGAPIQMLAYVSGIMLLTRSQRFAEPLQTLAPVGRMALSNYIFQSIISTFIFNRLGLFGAIGPTFVLIMTVLIYLMQIRVSNWWMRYYQFGPLEYVWRTLTYGKRQPLGRFETYDNLPPIRPLQTLRDSAWAKIGLVVLLGWLAWTGWNWVQNAQLEAQVDTPESAAAISVPAISTSIAQGIAINEATPTPSPTPYTPPQTTPINRQPKANAAQGDWQGLAEAFDTDRALAHIEMLTSDAFDGRYAGSEGGFLAADYIAEQFELAGLQPAGNAGTFYQPFPISYATLTDDPILSVSLPNGTTQTYDVATDYRLIIRNYMGAGEAEGEVVWVSDCTESDFAKVDMMGKIAFCRLGNTQLASRFALEAGAAGLLILAPDGFDLNFGTTYADVWVPEPIPAMMVSSPVAADLLAGSGFTVSELSLNFEPFSLQTTAFLSVSAATTEECNVRGCVGRNVLGVLPGSNPDLANEVVVIGGHYDHLGSASDGNDTLIWRGANDNASSIATIIEIAQLWERQGFVPQRTVLFAAWDAEETGLNGSTYYVENPRYLITDTVTYLNLDMVGAGEDILYINGANGVEDDLTDIAASVGVSTTLTDIGRSDHVPFQNAGIPASHIIWFGADNPDVIYHVTADTADTIEPEKLYNASVIAGMFLLSQAEIQPQLDTLLADRANAILTGNESAFLRNIAPDQRQNQRLWFADAQSLNPTAVTITADEVRLLADGVQATINTIITSLNDDGEERTHTARTVTNFNPTNNNWQWAGADLVAGGQDVTVLAPPRATDKIPAISASVSEQYNAILTQLDLPPATNLTLFLYNSSADLRGDTALTLGNETSGWVGQNNLKLVYSPNITNTIGDTLVEWVLVNAGIFRSDAPWLWQGLPLVLNYADDTYTAHTTQLPALHAAFAADELPINTATAWAQTDHLRQQLGWAGLGDFIQNAGRNGIQNLPDWQTAWQTQLDTAQTQLDTLLAIRQDAILANQPSTFLSTVDPTIPNLVTEQQNWFANTTTLNLTEFTLTAIPTALLPDGAIVADVQFTFAADLGDNRVLRGEPISEIKFTQGENGLQWAGAPFATLRVNGLQLLYPPNLASDVATQLITDTLRLLPDLTATLGTTAPPTLTLKLYNSPDTYRTSVALDLPVTTWAFGYTAPDESIKLLQSNDLQSTNSEATITQLTRQLLHQNGVTNEWVLKLATASTNPNLQSTIFANLQSFERNLNRDTFPDYATIAPDAYLTEDQWKNATTQAWDMNRYIASAFGRDTFRQLWRTTETDTNAITQAIFNQTAPEFLESWRTSLAQNHLSPDNLALNEAFDANRVNQHIQTLAQPAWAGRQAGSDGATEAANYIADQFAEFGLTPAVPNYQQTFDINYVEMWTTPRLDLTLPDGTVDVFTYRHDFVTVVGEMPAGGIGSGELVWIAGEYNESFDLTGKIVVRSNASAIVDEMILARDHNAAGLLLVADVAFDTEEERLAKPALPTTPPITDTIPTLLLTGDGFIRLLAATGQTFASMNNTPPAFPMLVDATILVPLTPAESRQTSNVLGYIKGSDPTLRDEIVVIGAHYDHVGDDPATVVCNGNPITDANDETSACERLTGLTYSGANDNASGVGVLLEIAQLWQEQGYRPARTVLFAAWGAQEAGEIGASAYITNPVFPLTDTIAVFHLDGVGGGSGFRLAPEGTWAQEGNLLFGMERAENILNGRLSLSQPDPDRLPIPFRDLGIPTLFVGWSDATELNLPDSEADEVEVSRLHTSGRMTLFLLLSTTE